MPTPDATGESLGPPPADYPSLNLLLAAAVARSPERRLFQHASGWSLTYNRSGSLVRGVAGRLADLGLGPGDSVVCYLDETVALAVFVLGCAQRRVLAAPLAPSFSLPYLGRMAEQLGTRFVFTTPARAQDVRSIGLVPLCFAGSRLGSPELAAAGAFEAVPEDESGTPSEVLAGLEDGASGIDGTDPMFIQPTSGSTGHPKLVLRRHAGLTRYARFVGAEIGPGPHRFLATAALTHAFGWHMFATALAAGAELVVPSRIDTAARIDEVRRLDPTVLPTTPRVLRSLCRQHLFRVAVDPTAPLFGPSAAFVCSAGGRSEPKLLRYVRSHGLGTIEFYGSSEASVVALTPRDDWREGWAGRLLPDVRARIAADGEILLASPGMMLGYHRDPASTEAAFDADGYYQTGDIGELTADGYLRILGRKKDVFNTPEGSNIHPERLELLLESLRWSRQAMLVGDQRPYLSALITVRHRGQLAPDGPGGMLDPTRHAGLYRECALDLARLNSDLEQVERIRAFLLLASDLPEQVYTVVGPAKVRRDRRAVLTDCGPLVHWLYADGRLAEPSPAVVP